MAVAPGLVLTPDVERIAGILSEKQGITPQQYYDRLAEDMTPAKRFATPEEVAKFFVFLASKNASYCLGMNYYVDGGAIKGLH
jgi:NAD(P)-dependent dehydrogenase (short-subunit alcohol dehydrogenase family)